MLLSALEMQHRNPSEPAALAPPRHHPVLADASGCCCTPCHHRTLFSTKMLFGSFLLLLYPFARDLQRNYPVTFKPVTLWLEIPLGFCCFCLTAHLWKTSHTISAARHWELDTSAFPSVFLQPPDIFFLAHNT